MEQRIKPKLGVVITAGGQGLRMGGAETPKQFRILGQMPMLAHSINLFSQVEPSCEIVVVLPHEHMEYWTNLASRFSVAEHTCVVGGEERFHSVRCGIEALSLDCELIAVHDGVRPLCSVELVDRAIYCALSSGSAIPVVDVVDSYRSVEGGASKCIDRTKLKIVQTPQIFDSALLRRAYAQPYSKEFTDEASVVESLHERLYLCLGERTNIKITTLEDLIFANALLQAYEESIPL